MAKQSTLGKRGPAHPLNNIIRNAERANTVRLSEPAKRVLKVSVAELNMPQTDPQWAIVRDSVDKIVRRAAGSPEIRTRLAMNFSTRLSRSSRMVSANAIQRSIHALWCNIPPFCGPDPEDTDD